MILRRTHIVLLIAILLSVAIRIPNINRPLSKHHEFVTAHILRVMQIWHEGGIANYHFAPVMNYVGANNKYINNQSMGYCDVQGDYYYLSYPPLNFILPYLIFESLHIAISPLALQIFNTLMHIITALILYRIVLLLVRNEWAESIATLATVFFLINPCALWFFGNVYFADMLVIFFWLAATWLLLLIRDEEKFYLKLSLLAGTIILGNYTEYLMLMFSGGAILFVLTTGYKSKALIISTIIVSIIIPYALTIYQYSQVGGFEALLHQSVARYESRSGYHVHNPFLAFISQSWIILQNYVLHYIAFILLFIGSVIIFIAKRKELIAFDAKALGYLIIGPIILHHLIFLNASMHDFQVLKSSVPICIIAAIILYSYFPVWRLVFAFFILIINVADYYYINRPGEHSRNGDTYADERMMGASIKANAPDLDDRVIFFNTDVSPQMVYYAHRNIFRYATKQNAVNFLREHNLSKGILFYFKDGPDKPNHLVRIEQFTP